MQVIISLQEGRPHIPYRNSVLTMVLRDSLGGNTRTVMVAAVAPEAAHVEESISTCRFAQRVAMISNRQGGGGCMAVGPVWRPCLHCYPTTHALPRHLSPPAGWR